MVEKYKQEVDLFSNNLDALLQEVTLPEISKIVIEYAQIKPVYAVFSSWWVIHQGFVGYGYINSDDEEEGLWITWYEDTQTIFSKGYYHQGVKEGIWEEYHKNGRLKSSGSYNQGKKEGYWIENGV